MPIAAASKGGPPPDSESTTSQGRSRSRTGSRTPFSRFEIGVRFGVAGSYGSGADTSNGAGDRLPGPWGATDNKPAGVVRGIESRFMRRSGPTHGLQYRVPGSVGMPGR